MFATKLLQILLITCAVCSVLGNGALLMWFIQQSNQAVSCKIVQARMLREDASLSEISRAMLQSGLCWGATSVNFAGQSVEDIYGNAGVFLRIVGQEIFLAQRRINDILLVRAPDFAFETFGFLRKYLAGMGAYGAVVWTGIAVCCLYGIYKLILATIESLSGVGQRLASNLRTISIWRLVTFSWRQELPLLESPSQEKVVDGAQNQCINIR